MPKPIRVGQIWRYVKEDWTDTEFEVIGKSRQILREEDEMTEEEIDDEYSDSCWRVKVLKKGGRYGPAVGRNFEFEPYDFDCCVLVRNVKFTPTNGFFHFSQKVLA